MWIEQNSKPHKLLFSPASLYLWIYITCGQP